MSIDRTARWMLLQGLRDEDGLVRWTSALELRERGLDKLKMKDRILCLVCLGQADKLAELGEPAVPALVGFLGKDAADTRIATKALVKIGPPAVPALVNHLKDETEAVRPRVVEVLVKMGPPVVTELVRYMKSGKEATHRIARVLERIGADKIENTEDRVFCLFVLGNTGEVAKMGGEAVPALAGWLKSGDQLKRRMATETLLQIGLGELRRLGAEEQVLCLFLMGKPDDVVNLGLVAVPGILACLKHKEGAVQVNAIQALKSVVAHYPEPDLREAIPLIVDVFRDEKAGSRVREEAITAFGLLSDRPLDYDWSTTFPALLSCARGVERLARNAAHELLKLGGEKLTMEEKVLCMLVLEETNKLVQMGTDAVPGLAGALKTANANLRSRAAWLLGEIAKQTRIDLRIVEAALEEHVVNIRKNGDATATRNAMKEATWTYLRISGAVRERLAKEGSAMGGIALEGERPRPPSREKGTYRTAERRAML